MAITASRCFRVQRTWTVSTPCSTCGHATATCVATSRVNVADLPSLASAFNGEIKTSMGLDRMRAMLSIANDFSGPNVHRVVLVPPFTSEGFAGDQSVVFPDWNRILPLVHQTFR